MDKYFPEIRRSDREETKQSFLKCVLNDSVVCSLAVETGEFPLIQVLFYAYDEHNNDLIFHFSKHGFAGQEICNGKKVCISISKYGRLFTATRAVDFGCEYQSVILYGHIKILEEEGERLSSMQILFDKFFSHIPTDSYDVFTTSQCEPINIVRVKIEKWLGKEYTNPSYATSLFYPFVNPLI